MNHGYKCFGATTLLLVTCSTARVDVGRGDDSEREWRRGRQLRVEQRRPQRKCAAGERCGGGEWSADWGCRWARGGRIAHAALLAKTVTSYRFLNGCLVVAPDWNSVSCGEEFSSESFNSFRTVNAIDRTWPPSPHLPVFSNFTPHVVAPWRDDVITDFLGMAVQVPMYCNGAYMSQPVAHALRTRQCRRQSLQGRGGRGGRCRLQTSWLVVSEVVLNEEIGRGNPSLLFLCTAVVLSVRSVVVH